MTTNKKIRNKFPPGWTERRVRQVIAHYDRQNDDEAIAEDERRVRQAQTTMRVPSALVGKVRNLIAQHQQKRRSA
jgi:hypothetical protein